MVISVYELIAWWTRHFLELLILGWELFLHWLHFVRPYIDDLIDHAWSAEITLPYTGLQIGLFVK